MSNDSADVTFYAEGSTVALAPDASGDVVLANATTYYAEIGHPQRSLASMHWRWAAALVASITYERSNFPDADLHAAATSGPNWQDSGYAATLAAGGAAGGAIADFSSDNVGRMRAKVVVTTGAKLRGRPHHKGAI